MNFLELVMPYVVDIAATLLITLIGVLGTLITTKITQSKQLENINNAINQVTKATQDTVLELKQTVSDAWKESAENGKLTDEQVAALKKALLKKTASKLAAPTVALLEGAKIDVSAIITSVGEALISKINSGDK